MASRLLLVPRRLYSKVSAASLGKGKERVFVVGVGMTKFGKVRPFFGAVYLLPVVRVGLQEIGGRGSRECHREGVW